MQKMVDQHTAYFIVKPLLHLRPILTLRLIQFLHHSQTVLIRVMSQPILQQRLIQVKPLSRKLFRMRVFPKEFIEYMSRLVPLLNKTENLVDLIRNDIPVFILLVFLWSFLLPVLRIVLPILLWSSHRFRSSLLFGKRSSHQRSTLQTQVRLLLHPFRRLTIKRQYYRRCYLRHSWLRLTRTIHL